MRAIAAIIIGISAASFGFAGAARAYDAYGPVRAEPLFIYDSQPGIFARAYWRTPWRNRHYFPATGKRPKIGRAENLNAPRHYYPMAESYYRSWSTNALFPPPVAAPIPVRKTSGPLQ